ncbi:MAG: hypothetical protein PF445_05360 [Melioribacteraceae bacterium]|jgi:hypothetical protein|nr:hypothetical protein [Melioribacteraceae bacterium]
MINYLQKYRPLVYTISLFYLSFFLFSPFFHHHHGYAEYNQENVTKSHSNLLDNVHDDDLFCTTHCSLGETNHNHIQIVSTVFTSQSRTFQINHVYAFYSIQFYSPDISEIVSTRNLINNPTVLSQWEKSINTATNVSPPIA